MGARVSSLPDRSSAQLSSDTPFHSKTKVLFGRRFSTGGALEADTKDTTIFSSFFLLIIHRRRSLPLPLFSLHSSSCLRPLCPALFLLLTPSVLFPRDRWNFERISPSLKKTYDPMYACRYGRSSKKTSEQVDSFSLSVSPYERRRRRVFFYTCDASSPTRSFFA